MFTLLAILTQNKLQLNNNFMKEKMMKISLKEEIAKMFQSLNSGVNKRYFCCPQIPDRLWGVHKFQRGSGATQVQSMEHKHFK
jgi:hypothetical protein